MTSFHALAKEQVAGKKNEVVYQKKTVIDFSDVLISGELTKPDGIYIKTRKSIDFKPLVELPKNIRTN